MCGIAGYITTKPLDHETIISRMLKALVHRGPDSEGRYSSGLYHAGMRRLSINDVEGGDQPLFNSDKSVALLYNGEIYNSPALRQELETKGYKFRTRSDGEVICHLYREYGEDLFEKLDGMFAAALWIESENKLILARDIPGEKPLYYTALSDHEIVFASELKSLTQFSGLDLTLNYQAIWDFPTFTWIPQPDTIYRSIFSLPRSTILIVDEHGMRLRSFTNRFNQQPIDLSDQAVIEETRRVVEEAVKSRLLSDVPLGCFLSGGIDSSTVATIAAKYAPALTTFTIGFEDMEDPHHGRTDESAQAEGYARKLGTTHHTIRVGAEDFQDSLLSYCYYGDQPFAVPSGLGILMIAKAAHERGIKVLLSGDCADENFGGYSWYPYLSKSKTPFFSSSTYKICETTFNTIGFSLEERLRVLSSYSPQKRAWAWHYYASEEEKKKLFNPELFTEAKSSLRHFFHFKKSNDWQAEDFIRQDREFYLVNEMLQKLDRMTMAHSVEGRVPFAAPAVLAHAAKLRYHHMVRGNTLKWALRNAVADLLPKEICERPKHGFNVPIDQWLRGDWAELLEETFSQDSQLMRHGLIQLGSRDAAYQMAQDVIHTHGPTLFSYIMLNLWLGTIGK